MNETTVVKDGESEIAVPQAWRPTLTAIADALIQRGEPLLPRVSLQSPDVWVSAQENIRAYGAHLRKLPDESWNSSFCIWYGDFWGEPSRVLNTIASPLGTVADAFEGCSPTSNRGC